MFELIPSWFIRYKFFNSLFLGVSVGAVFTIYSPLEPSVYSLGGIFLALGILLVARFYHHILNAPWLFRISLFVEIILLLAMFYFMLKPYTYMTALIFYIGYQITFVFGSYLVRAETLLLKTDILLTRVDTSKQLGYLLGMGLVYLFYEVLNYYGVKENREQVYALHYLLVVIEIVVICFIFKSFKRELRMT